jgi:hypothetical protein
VKAKLQGQLFVPLACALLADVYWTLLKAVQLCAGAEWRT